LENADSGFEGFEGFEDLKDWGITYCCRYISVSNLEKFLGDDIPDILLWCVENPSAQSTAHVVDYFPHQNILKLLKTNYHKRFTCGIIFSACR
jgi:hypothetical protein